MSNFACIGGILSNGRFVRLLNEFGYNQDSETEFEVGDVYAITFNERTYKRPPHMEDILVTSSQYRSTFSNDDRMVSYLKKKFDLVIWRGGLDSLFDGKLEWTINGSGYISIDGEIPDYSVGFWMPDNDLVKNICFDKVRYEYPSLFGGNLPYVGFHEPVDMIPSYTLLRVSLARWWDNNGKTEERCYLQLSGWYTLIDEFDDEVGLPF